MIDDIFIPADETTEIVIEETDEATIQIEDEGQSGQMIRDYSQLRNKPQIEGVTLMGDKSFEDLGLTELSNLEIQDIINNL